MGHYVTWQEAMVAMACYSTLLVKYSSIWAKTGFADVDRPSLGCDYGSRREEKIFEAKRHIRGAKFRCGGDDTLQRCSDWAVHTKTY